MQELSEVADLPDTSTVIEGEHFTPTVREALNIKGAITCSCGRISLGLW